MFSVDNPPQISVEGILDFVEGESLTVSALVITDPAGSSVEISWDVNSDAIPELTEIKQGWIFPNQPTDSNISTLTLSWAQLVALGYDGGSPTNWFSTFPLTVTATDSSSTTETQSYDVFVQNAAPVISVLEANATGGGGACGGGGGDVTISTTILEAGPASELAELSAVIDWGDGTVEPVTLVQVGEGQYSVAASDSTHSYAEGTYSIQLTVLETDILQAGASQAVAFDSVSTSGGGGGGGPQTACLDNGVLTVNGSAGADMVIIASINGSVQVNSNFPTSSYSFPAGEVSQIVALLGDGDDIIVNLSTTAMVAVGGAGTDILTDAGGRSILIGGAGIDVLSGGGGQDILIDSSTDHDADTAALLALLIEWNQGADAAIGTRIASLTDANGPALNSSTIDDDGSFDLLIGGSGTDWILLHSGDLSLGLFDELDLL